MTDREAMKMALAKLEHLWEIGIDAEYKVELLPEIEALRQALAQPEQEPVRWFQQFGDAPPKREWVGLTDETLDDVYFCVEGGTTPLETWREQARAIEAKLKEKNT